MLKLQGLSRLLAFSLALALASAPGGARAECVTADVARSSDTCVVVDRAGVKGVWFALPVADELRKIKLEVPELRLQVGKLEALLEVERRRVLMFRESSELRRQALQDKDKQVDRALTAGATAQAESSAWYRSPVLWFSVGTLVAGVLFGGAMGIARAKSSDR